MKILITGGSGYFGRLLIPELLKRDWIELVLNIDEKPYFVDNPKYVLIQKNLLEDFEQDISQFGHFDVIFHLAYKIRRPYFKNKLLLWRKENLESTQRIFKFGIENGIKKFIHASTVALYVALPKNNLSKMFNEEDPLPSWPYDYAENKKEIEAWLKSESEKFNQDINVIILRIASVAGPSTKSFKKLSLFNFLKSKFPFMFYVREDSGRQYLHENDLVRAFIFLIEHNFDEKFLVFNLAPKDFLTFKEMARLDKKIPIKIPYLLGKILFTLLWHLSLGKLPTPPHAIDSFSFPIYVDGSKIEKYGFQYHYSSKEAYLMTH